jgi:iron complex outermembrane receptor protein
LVGGALSDNLFGKVTVNHREHDGFVENVVLNKDQQDEDQTSFRGQLRWVGDNSEWLLSGDYMEDDREDMGRTPIVNNAPLTQILAINGGGDARQSGAPADGFSKREAWGISLTGELKFDSGTLTMIAAHRHADTDWEMASAGAPLGSLGLPFDEVIDDIVEDIDTNSLELRWTSDLDGSFNYTAGFFYFTEETDRVEQFKITRAGTFDGAPPIRRVVDLGDQAIIGNEYSKTANETTSYAVYGQGTWDISEQMSLIVGARYTVDEKDYSATSVNCGADRTGTPFENFAPCAGLGGSLRIIAESFTVNPSDDWNDFSPMASLQYRPSDETMVFFTASKGFKSGGFAGSQGVESAASNPVDPETAFNYEIGFKGDLLDNSLRLNAAVFYTDYEDLQIVRFGPVPNSTFGTFQTTNIGEAEIKGFEVEFTWFLTDNLSINGFYAFLDTEVDGLLIEGANGTFDASGQELLRAPENSSNMSINYSMPTSVGDIDFRLAFSHQDEQRTDYVDDRIIQDRFDLWDGRIGWTSNSGNVEVALWGKNLTDEDYISHMYVIGPGGIGVWGAPRTYGVSATWKM